MFGRKSTYPSRREILGTVGLALGAIVAPGLGLKQVRAAGYPERPIKIIVPFAPAGPTDIMARILSTHLGDAIGGTVIVENKPGAGGNIGIGAAAYAEPDGHTLLITSSAYVVNPGLYAKIPYDPYKDFAPIAELGTSPNVIMVGPRLGINSIADLIARAKADPNELNYASPGIGTTPHLSGELFKIVSGIQITHVPFSGAGPAIQAILSGTTQEDFAGRCRIAVGEVDRNPEKACHIRAIAQRWLRSPGQRA
jgi:tripartite-type tricarboxylate transporter receptor subunit TctC